MPEPALYIMCGLPFSGKTTLAGALASRCGFVHLDLDALARAKGLFPEEGISEEQWGALFREAYRQVSTLLASGISVVFDAVNYDRVGRDRLRVLARRSHRPVHVIYLQIPVRELEQRRQANRANERRSPVRENHFAELLTEFETPTAEEDVLIYDGAQPIPEWIEHHIHCEPGAGRRAEKSRP